MNDSHHENLAAGTVIDGKYRVERIIGAGGMGAVYEAMQMAIERKVAVKLLHSMFCHDPQVVERFHREARLAGSIGNDNICEVTDLGTYENGAPYLVMPVLKGQSLGEVLTDNGNGKPLSLIRLGDIICQTLSALQAAHDAGIVHRDLKPDNIFVTTYGDREDFVKLLDFGISKVLESDSVSNLTRTGTVVGTPFYMAPEQARGSKDIDLSIDIYAIGVIMYEALVGKRPYEGDSYNEIMFKIIAEPFLSPRRIDPSLPESIEQIILKAMAKDPTARFSSPHEMREAVKEAVGTTSSPQMPLVTSTATAVSNSGPFTPTALGASATPSFQPGQSVVDPYKATTPSQAPAYDQSPSPVSMPQASFDSDPAMTQVPSRSPSGSALKITLVVAVVVVAVAVVAFLLKDSNEPATPITVPLSAPVPTAPETKIETAPELKSAIPKETPPPEPVSAAAETAQQKETRAKENSRSGRRKAKKTAKKVLITENPPSPKQEEPVREVTGRQNTKLKLDYD